MRVSVITLVLVGAPQIALACPVCFGQSDSPLAVATNMAIFFMLGVTGSVLAAFASFILYLKRRASALDAGEAVRGGASDDRPATTPYVLNEKGSV
ncbi:MAG TPA: hypothetical protein VM818_06545 [Vicinamibacterales bacterium]|nr:hypothetical protein [Vicinamibacterales bacterium]